jgi:predicted regulator of Ras-like GTPase activity (Roadblock/LC7/MglB family)
MTPLNHVERALCERALRDLVQAESGVEYALLASPDGFEIARVARAHPLNGARVAAMASSIFAVGAAMASELRLGSCRNLVVEAEKGFLTLFTVPCQRAPLVLWAVALQNTTLGMVLAATRGCARELARQLDMDNPARNKTPQLKV